MVLGKHFYLLDTFRGMDERFVSPEDKASGALEKNAQNLASGFYAQGIEEVRANFSQGKNVSLIEGSIPETLPRLRAEKVAYLDLDMNCSVPEIPAVRFFWERLVPGRSFFSMITLSTGTFRRKLRWIVLRRKTGSKFCRCPLARDSG